MTKRCVHKTFLSGAEDEDETLANLWKCNEANTQHFLHASFPRLHHYVKSKLRAIINQCPAKEKKQSKKTNPMSTNKQRRMSDLWFSFLRNVFMACCRLISLIYLSFRQNKCYFSSSPSLLKLFSLLWKPFLRFFLRERKMKNVETWKCLKAFSSLC